MFRRALMTAAIFHGMGCAEIEKDNRGVPVALWPLEPGYQTERRDENGKLFIRHQNPGGGFVDLDPTDVLVIKANPEGKSVIEYAAQSIGWARATEIFGSTFFGEGMNPSGIVEVQKKLDPDAADILREEMENLYKGPRGKRTAVLDAGMKFTKLATAPNDAQFIETRQHQVEEICRWFGVPPHKVMHLLRATFSNIEHQSIEVVVDSITPWVKIWEEEADYKLFGVRNRQGLYTKMNLKSLLRGDSQARADFYFKLFGTAGMSINDILRAEDLPTIGTKGDVRFVPSNFQTLDAAIAAGEKAVRDAKAPPPAPPAPPQPQNPPEPGNQEEAA